MSQNKKTDTACSQATQAQTMPHRLLSARHVRDFGVFRGVSVGAAVHVTARNLMRAVVRTAAAIASPAAARAGLAAVFGALAIVASPPAQAAESGATPRPAHGLIVKLKDAPAHAAAMERRQDNGRLRGDVERERMQRVMGQAGVAALKTRPSGRASQLLDFGRVLSGREAEQLAAQLRLRPEVEWVVPNERERRLQSTINPPNDELFAAAPGEPGQWWLFANGGNNTSQIDFRRRGVPSFQTAWATDVGNSAVVVAVLDTGITYHPDLEGRVLPGYDFVSEVVYAGDGTGRDSDPSDPGDFVSAGDKTGPNRSAFETCFEEASSWHGTKIAGMLAARTNNSNREGVAGMNWNGRVLPVRVAGKCGADVADIVDGMRWAAGLTVPGAPPNPYPAWVVNISFGGSEGCNEAYRDAIADLAAAGVVVVAAAGNENGAVTRPASCSGVVAVGALNRDGFKATYSNFGPAVTLATVGGDSSFDGAWGPRLADEGLLTLDNFGENGPGGAGYSYIVGSSFAAPIVAGTVGLMLSVNPNLNVAQIIAGLKASARPHVTSPIIGMCSDANPGRCICDKFTCGEGILDAGEAVLYAGNPSNYRPPVRIPQVIDNTEVRAAVMSASQDLPPNPESGGGGGALGFGWLLALGAAVSALAWRRSVRSTC